jgi:hypothetical protein
MGSTVQAVPSQCSIRDRSTPLLVTPTAHALHAESTATPCSELSSVPGPGGGMAGVLWQVSAAAAARVSPASSPAASSGAASTAVNGRARIDDAPFRSRLPPGPGTVLMMR